MRYDNHLNGCLFFYAGKGRGCLQVRAGNNHLVKLDATLVERDGAWWLAAGRAKDGKLAVSVRGRLTFANRGKLKATAELFKGESSLGLVNLWVAETDDGVPYLQLKPRTDDGADRRLPL